MNSKDDTRLNIRISTELKEFIQKGAKKENLNSSELVRYVLAWYFFNDDADKRKIISEGKSYLWSIENRKQVDLVKNMEKIRSVLNGY